MIVFSGSPVNGSTNDTWALSLGGDMSWTPIITPGPLPPTRTGASAIYDPVGDRVVIFGGERLVAGNVVRLNDVWSLSLAGTPAWTQMTPTGVPPIARSEHSAIFDPLNQRMIIYGGGFDEVWSLFLGAAPAWSHILVAGVSPGVRSGQAAVYDPIRQDMIVMGGYTTTYQNDVWKLPLSGTPVWTNITPGGTVPGTRHQHTMVYDSLRDRFVVSGGATTIRRRDVWALTAGPVASWTLVSNVLELPISAEYCSAIYDPVRDRLVTFGGLTGSGVSSQLFILPLDAPGRSWVRMAAVGTGPSPRHGHSAIYDPVGDRMIVFGGNFGLNDTWELSLSEPPTWTQLQPGGTLPPGRGLHAAVYDLRRHRMLIHGGERSVGDPQNLVDTWVLNLSAPLTWASLEPAGNWPSGRYLHAAIYDPIGDRMIITAGHVFGHPEYDVNDFQELRFSGDLSEWRNLNPSGITSYGHSLAAIYDPVRHRMVIGGGNSPYIDNWALPLTGAPIWNHLTPIGTPKGHRAAVYDPRRDRVIFFRGGLEVSALTWGEPVAVAIPVSNLVAVWENGEAFIRWNVDDYAEHHTFQVYRGDVSSERQPLSNRVLQSGESEYYAVDDNAPETGGQYWLRAVDRGGMVEWFGPVRLPMAPVSLQLIRSVSIEPNPAITSSFVRFVLAEASPVEVTIVDIKGRLVRTLVHEMMEEGEHNIAWEGTGLDNELVAAGVYFVRVMTPSQEITKKLVRLR